MLHCSCYFFRYGAMCFLSMSSALGFFFSEMRVYARTSLRSVGPTCFHHFIFILFVTLIIPRAQPHNHSICPLLLLMRDVQTDKGVSKVS